MKKEMQTFPIQLPVTYEKLQVIFSTATGTHRALRDVSFSLEPGEWLAIVGRNGSGKSTMAKVIAGLLPISAGRVLSGEGPHCKIRMIGQQPDAQIIGETVYEDVCFGLENDRVDAHMMREQAIKALSSVGLENHFEHPVSELSGGQKQLLAIASALAVKAELLVFDEATSMLDPTARQQVLTAAKQLHDNGTTIVWITQNMEELALATRVLAFEQGVCVFEGRPEIFFYGEHTYGIKVDRAALENGARESVPSNVGKSIWPAEGSQLQGKKDCSTDKKKQPMCDQLGMRLPYEIQIGRELIAQGVPIGRLPLTIEDLREVVKIPCC